MDKEENISYLLNIAGKEKLVLTGSRENGALLWNDTAQRYDRYSYKGGFWRDKHGNVLDDGAVTLEWCDPMTVCAMAFVPKEVSS